MLAYEDVAERRETQSNVGIYIYTLTLQLLHEREKRRLHSSVLGQRLRFPAPKGVRIRLWNCLWTKFLSELVPHCIGMQPTFKSPFFGAYSCSALCKMCPFQGCLAMHTISVNEASGSLGEPRHLHLLTPRSSSNRSSPVVGSASEISERSIDWRSASILDSHQLHTLRSICILLLPVTKTRGPGKRTVLYNTSITSQEASEERALQGQTLQEGMGMN